MNKNEKVNNDDSLENKVNKYVAVKLQNGRVISGWLRETEDGYIIKLGVLHIPIVPENVKSIKAV